MSAKRGVILAIDQGTTGSTVVVLDADVNVLGRANSEFPQHYPKPGWVEHDPAEIWASIEKSAHAAIGQAGVAPEDIRAIGITNQRETTVVWDRATGEPIHRAIVWQCRRTTERCRALKQAGHGPYVRRKTGLVLDPYFSATKIAWILDQVPGARARGEAGELAFGTIDSWLLWRLTGGAVHGTEVSNASRTLLLDIATAQWDPKLLDIFDVPASMLPAVHSSSEAIGETRGVGFLPDGVPIAGMAGDQQAALFGQACFKPGEAKVTFGTGAFVLLNTGNKLSRSANGLLTTIAWRLGDGETVYALEGSVFIAGAAVQWLRDEMGFFESAVAIEALAASVPDSGGVTMVPAFAGLGAPHWDPEARGAILGLTRGSGRAHLARATLEGMAHQVADVVEAMVQDSGSALEGLQVDGGAAANNLLMQIQADLLGSTVRRPTVLETTALGAAFLAGIAIGFWSGAEEIASRWKLDRVFKPAMDSADREASRRNWRQAVARIRTS